MKRFTILMSIVLMALSVSSAKTNHQQAKPDQKSIDPAAWGGNHIGKPVPEYVHGDECLFCHRNTIGATWQKNAHGVALRQGEDAPEFVVLLSKQPSLVTVASQVGYFLGSRHRLRFLKKSGYGKFALLNTQAVIGDGFTVEKLVDAEKPTWDLDKFGNRCAGCHATGVDSTTKTFTAFGLDCYVCHGDATLDHTKDTSLMWLSKKRRDDSRAITSICAQCHLRSGKSRSTGLPYANAFIAGDNLFQDFEVDLTKAEDGGMNPADRHVLRNVRDVVLRGEQGTNCLSCHDVHDNSTAKHRGVQRGEICADCHGLPFKPQVKRYEVHSALCEY